jgi:hypothetical protein
LWWLKLDAAAIVAPVALALLLSFVSGFNLFALVLCHGAGVLWPLALHLAVNRCADLVAADT